MKNNIIFICPSWEERTYMGFERDLSDINPIKVVAIQKENPINGVEILKNIEKLKGLCKQRNITYDVLLWTNSPAKNNQKLDNYLKQEVLDGYMCIWIYQLCREILSGLFFRFLNIIKIMLTLDIMNRIYIMKHG